MDLLVNTSWRLYSNRHTAKSIDFKLNEWIYLLSINWNNTKPSSLNLFTIDIPSVAGVLTSNRKGPRICSRLHSIVPPCFCTLKLAAIILFENSTYLCMLEDLSSVCSGTLGNCLSQGVGINMTISGGKKSSQNLVESNVSIIHRYCMYS